MLKSAFQFHLHQPIHGQQLVTVGRFDGVTVSLAYASSSDTVSVYSPHIRHASGVQQGQHESRKFTINRKISALTTIAWPSAGQQKLASGHAGSSVLLIGSSHHLLAYNVETNQDIFYREVPDGVQAMTVARIHASSASSNGMSSFASASSPHSSPSNLLAIVGGNCSIQGYDKEGNDMYWTVTGDNVTALASRRTKSGNVDELLVASEDYTIRIFQNEEIVHEVTEVDVVNNVCTLQHHTSAAPTNSSVPPAGTSSMDCYAYSLQNGTIGVYRNATKVWSLKVKQTPVCMVAYDINGDGAVEVICGYSSGLMECRDAQTGEVIYVDQFNTAIAAILVADYRMEGTDQLIVCSSEGEVRGYTSSATHARAAPAAANASGAAARSSVTAPVAAVPDKQLTELNAQRQQLQRELQLYEEQMKKVSDSKLPTTSKDGSSADKAPVTASNAIIPVDTHVTVSMKLNKLSSACMLTLSTNNDTVIKLALLENDLLFDSGSKLLHPNRPSSTLSVALRPEKYHSTEITIKAVVGLRHSTQDHCFDLSYSLAKFASFIAVRPRDIQPRGVVTFALNERVNRVVLWLNQVFNIDEKQPNLNGTNLTVSADSLHGGFVSIRDGTPVILKMTATDGGQLQIKTDSMELAGELIQDLSTYLKLEHVECVAEFPHEWEELAVILEQVQAYNAARLKLNAEIADVSNALKSALVRAEDSRLLHDTRGLLKAYQQLSDLNNELQAEYHKRYTNHQELLRCLKEVNAAIQRASRLRVGPPKTQLVAACRAALKANNAAALLQVMKTGSSK